MITLRMSGEMGFGPLEENDATSGAETSLNVSATKIVASGFLQAFQVSLDPRTELSIKSRG